MRWNSTSKSMPSFFRALDLPRPSRQLNPDFRSRLNAEQERALQMVQTGHNALITGRAGTGKSFLVHEIVRSLCRSGKSVRIVCSSGIAATVYSNASTVHSFYRLRTAELPWKALVERSSRDSQVCQNISHVHSIIWDEVSMSSRRLIEIVNMIHLHVSKAVETPRPFNGIQVIMVGDFQQLRPVSNLFDSGQFMFQSPVFQQAITHRIELTQSMRQDVTEEKFMAFLEEMRGGICSNETEVFVSTLKRDLAPELKDKATHIFFKKIPAQFFNQCKLDEMLSEEHTFQAVDNGDTEKICSAEYILVLKPGCKVMLIWNKSDQLRNGSPGLYVGKDGPHLVVDFDGVGRVRLREETWEKMGRHGEVIGRRTQFPVILMYGVTCHKAQGLTLPAVVVHSSKEFVPGLLYVACTRVRSSKHIQVLDFSRRQVMPADNECISVCDGNQEVNKENFECCRDHIITADDLKVHEREDREDARDDDYDINKVNEVIEQTVASFFERGDPEDLLLDLETVYAVLSDEASHAFLKTPPESFDIASIMKGMKVAEPLCERAESKNLLIDKELKNNDLVTLGKVLWCRACKIILEESMLANDSPAIRISSKQWSLDTGELYMMMSRSASFLTDLKLFFCTTELSIIQSAVGNELLSLVYEKVVANVAERVTRVIKGNPIIFNVKDMPIEGKAKIRHIGAWAVAKVFHTKLKYVKQHMTTSNRLTRESVKKSLEISNLLEENVIANISQLQQTSVYPDTLSVTEERQYRCRGLMHIEDSAYEFFLDLEQMRVDNLNEDKLLSRQENIIDDAIDAVKTSASLRDKWKACFQQDADGKAVDDLYESIITRYMMAGAGQYLRDFRLAHRLKKSAEHRKKVLERKTAIEAKKALLPFADFATDRSVGKVSCHQRLQAYVEKFGESTFLKMYTNVQLKQLCQAYNVPIQARATKASIGKLLLPAIKTNVSMVCPYFLDNLQSSVNVDDTNRRVSIRIIRS